MPNFIIIEGYYKWLFPLVITLISIVVYMIFIDPFRKRIYNIEHFVKENLAIDGLTNILSQNTKQQATTAEKAEKDTTEEAQSSATTAEETAKTAVASEAVDEAVDTKSPDTTQDTTPDTKLVTPGEKKEPRKEHFTNAILVQDDTKGIHGYNYEDYNTQYKSLVEMQKVSTKRNTQCESSLNKKIQEYEKMNVMYNYEPELLEKPKTSYYNGIGSSDNSLFSNKK